jgi:UDPglucose 6-dehydrogenase
MSNKFTLGMVGGGFIGTSCRLFENDKVTVKVFDLDPSKCSNGITSLKDLQESDLIFIAVPTPMEEHTGKCYTKYVENAISQVRETLGEETDIVIRSTVPVGFCIKNKVMYVPEFLREKHWKEDFLNCKNWYIGIDNKDEKVISKFETLFNNSFPDTIRSYLSTDECIAIKHFRNTFLATKVSFCNEFRTFCEGMNLDYEIVRKYATEDSRIGDSHSYSPGPDKHKGFGQHCLVKDLNSLIQQAKSINVKTPILESVNDRNNTIDRPEKDWMSERGRIVI